MITAEFEKVTHGTVRDLLMRHAIDKKFLIPTWTSFTVNVRIPDNATPVVSLFDRYSFEVTESGAFDIISSLRNTTRR